MRDRGMGGFSSGWWAIGMFDMDFPPDSSPTYSDLNSFLRAKCQMSFDGLFPAQNPLLEFHKTGFDQILSQKGYWKSEQMDHAKFLHQHHCYFWGISYYFAAVEKVEGLVFCDFCELRKPAAQMNPLLKDLGAGDSGLKKAVQDEARLLEFYSRNIRPTNFAEYFQSRSLWGRWRERIVHFRDLLFFDFKVDIQRFTKVQGEYEMIASTFPETLCGAIAKNRGTMIKNLLGAWEISCRRELLSYLLLGFLFMVTMFILLWLLWKNLHRKAPAPSR